MNVRGAGGGGEETHRGSRSPHCRQTPDLKRQAPDLKPQ